MSLYNMMFGVNALAGPLMSLLDIKVTDVARFRDCYLNTQQDPPRIAIYTRTGGNNRVDFDNSALTRHPQYLSDADDDFDNTYATYYFSIPPEWMVVIKAVQEVLGEASTEPPSDKFKRLIEELHRGEKNPQTERALEVGEQILGQIKEALK